jgi:hypothetical protein
MTKLMALLLEATLMFTLLGCIGCKAETTDAAITLEGDSISVDGRGATVYDTTVVIWSAGTYIVSGTLDDGQIMVNTGAAETVNLVLMGASISCSTSAPIYVVNAEETVITLAEGTENYITDGKAYVFADITKSEPSAAVFSKDDLTIGGSGSLTVKANFMNGIQGKDDLLITGGHITVNAVEDAIKGKDSIVVTGGTITVKAGEDGLQSNNDSDAAKGYVTIEGGTLNITAADDGLQAETNILIDGGTINIDSADDSIHSNGSLTVNGGDITLASGDGALHADGSVVINGVVVHVTRCSKTIESASVTMNDGNVVAAASSTATNS